ncbi:hypothetical protein B0T24DRAFT_592414 [Lasiosphaeria ovina]|uniref:Uncharacterized protein n=1 Tax=Lasiosphaeria ovina TaxID=92902 RepID=A0AAE0KHT6_9PEZI|nr:hypothetical protein B0T24DRAFT_592414 [Lasiosphaeria ovina]
MKFQSLFLCASAFTGGIVGASPSLATSKAAAASLATKTRIWSTTESSVTYYQFINPRKITLITTKTVTSYEPSVATLPTTVTEMVVSHVTWEDRISYSNGDRSTSITSFVATVPETWAVAKPQPTDLPAGTGAGAAELQCSEELNPGRPEAAADPLCTAHGLKTGCQGQCALRDNSWWCFEMHERDYTNAALRMGRACWGGNLEFRQLNTPCVVGDVGMACVPGQGLNTSWGAVNWEGPEAAG